MLRVVTDVHAVVLCTVGFLPLELSVEHLFWSGQDVPYTAQSAWGGVDMPADHARL